VHDRADPEARDRARQQLRIADVTLDEARDPAKAGAPPPLSAASSPPALEPLDTLTSDLAKRQLLAGDWSQATDWLPHSVRAALTGLKKKGHAIERGRRDDVTFYFAKQEG
jgi:hypothetical protein